MFPKEVDYYIFGKFLKISNNIEQDLKNFSGIYTIINSNLYIDKIQINDKLTNLKINLSKFCD